VKRRGGYLGAATLISAALTLLMLSIGVWSVPAGAQATPNPPTISNIPTSPVFNGNFVASVTTNSDGTATVTSNTPSVCTVGGDNLTVTFVGVGSCTLTAHTAGTVNFDASDGAPQPFSVGQATPSTPEVTNIPGGATFGETGFSAAVSTNGDGTKSVVTNTPSICTVAGDGVTVSYASAGLCTLTAQVGVGTNYTAGTGTPQSFSIGQATPSPAPTISNLPSNPAWTPGGGFTAQLGATDTDGAQSATSSTTGVCTASGLVVTYVTAGTCTLTAHTAASTDYAAASGSQQTFTIEQVAPTPPTISNVPTNATWSSGGQFTAVLSGTDSDGTQSVTSSTTAVCTASGLVVTYVTAGTCTLTAQTAASSNYSASSGSQQTFTIGQATPTPAPTISNLPSNPTWTPGGGFTAQLSTTDSDGAKSVSSSTTNVCTTSGLIVTYVTAGTCTLTAQTAAGTNYVASAGNQQTFTIGRATPTKPTITNIPSPANEFFGFTAIVGTTGDGTTAVTSSTPNVCSVGTDGLTVTFVGFGACTLTPSVTQGQNYFGATGSPQTFTVQEASHGYWLVGSDGGIFSFGSAAFHGSMGSTHLQRPVVGITPTSTGNGYWLPASDGGIFSFGDSTYYGSLPELGFHPAGSGQPQSLNAPIVGMVPSVTGHGYFMVASDGGVFAFGDAKFQGSCPGIGGCAGVAVAVMPDRSGKGYWLVTNVGGVYAFGDASFYGAPTPSSVPVVDAVATSDGRGYWLLFANGVVDNFGDAVNYGAPVGYVNGFNPATTIFPTLDSRGYWVASARGDVFSYGDSPFLGSMAAAGLNGEIIGAFGF
jgi:hypothetical protein